MKFSVKRKFNYTLRYFSSDIDLRQVSLVTVLLWVTLVKISISAFWVFILELMELASVWSYNDLNTYIDIKTGPNFLYFNFLNFIQAEDLSNPILILLACVGSVLIDTICIYLYVTTYHIKRYIIIMYLLFCLHPYFSFYTFRFDTMFFGKIACVLFIAKLLWKEKINSELSNFLILFLSMFRLSNLVFLFASMLSDRRLTKSEFNKTFVFSSLIFLILAYVVFTLNNNQFDTSNMESVSYTNLVLSTPTIYGWALEDTQKLFGTYGLALDNLILYTIKTVILFGGREAIYTTKFEYFDNSNFIYLEYFAVFGFALFNLVCLISFVLFAKRNKFLIPILLSFSLLVLHILTVSHMRYLIAFYPMLLIGWISLGQNNKKISVIDNIAKTQS